MEKPTKLPSGRWRARVFRDGRKVSLGTFATRKEAEARIAEAMVSTDEPKRGQVKFSKYAGTHIMVRKSDLAKGSWDNYVRSYRKHLEPTFGDKKLSDISPALVKRWWVSMADSPGPRRAAYMVLSNIMRAAVEDGEIASWKGIKGASKDVSAPRPTFSSGDVQMLRLLSTDPQVTCILWVLVASGLRIGEVLALDWEDIDMDRGSLRVYKHLTRLELARGRKKHDDADVSQAVTRGALEALQALRDSRTEKTGPVFLNAMGGRLSYHAWHSRWDALRKSCGLDHMHTHDIRAVHLTTFAERATLKETMERGGHADYRSALRYQRPDSGRQAQIVAQLEGAF